MHGRRENLQQTVVGNLNFNIQKNEARPVNLVMYKAKLKMDQGPQHKSLELLEEKIGSFLSL